MWWKISYDLFMANLEAQRVIALRMLKLSKGGKRAEHEAQRMVSEKVAAAAEAAFTLSTGGKPKTVLRRYRSIMRANARRLSK
jgi:hypothetical protein